MDVSEDQLISVNVNGWYKVALLQLCLLLYKPIKQFDIPIMNNIIVIPYHIHIINPIISL